MLEADFGDSQVVQMSRYLILVAVIAAAPLAVLPAKYAWEALRHESFQMTQQENSVVSVTMVMLCYAGALLLPNVGSVIAVTGATVNPFIGFIFPVLFYLRLDQEDSLSANKLIAKTVLFAVLVISLMGLFILL